MAIRHHLTKSSAAAAVVAISAFGLLGFSGAASASPAKAQIPESLSDCPANNMCAWENAGYAGRIIEMTQGCNDFSSCFASDFDDVASSLANFSNYEWCFYTGTEYTGRAYPVTAGAQVEYVGGIWNDEFESAHVMDIAHEC